MISGRNRLTRIINRFSLVICAKGRTTKTGFPFDGINEKKRVDGSHRRGATPPSNSAPNILSPKLFPSKGVSLVCISDYSIILDLVLHPVVALFKNSFKQNRKSSFKCLSHLDILECFLILHSFTIH